MMITTNGRNIKGVRQMSADDVSWWANWILVGALLIGVVATYAIVVSGNIKEANLKRELKEKDDALTTYKLTVESNVADAKKEGIEAGKAAGDALLRAAALEKEAAEAKERAAKLELELAKIKQPRLLGEDGMKVLAAQMTEFADTRFDVGVIPGDPEAFIFLSHVAAALEKACWKWIDWNPGGPLAGSYILPDKPNIGQFAFFGVFLIVDPAHADTLSKPALALVEALKAKGFESALEVVANPSIPNKDTVHITFGKKR
jgi:hypothetical protein